MPTSEPIQQSTVLVLGGYGAVGRHVVAEVRRAGGTAIAAGRDPSRADRVIDLRDPALTAYAAALEGVDVVVNAAGAEDLRVVEAATSAGVAFVEISATTDHVESLDRLTPAAPVLASVGIAPGLTNLVAAEVHRLSPGPVDIAIVLGAGEEHGAAATEWTYGLLGRRFDDGEGQVRNFTQPRTFDLPGFGRRRLLRADFSDQHTLRRQLGVPVRTFFAVDSRPATTALALLTRVPGGSRAPRGMHLPGSEDWLVLARGSDGTTRWVRGSNQSRGTATVAAAAVERVAGLPAGVHHLHEVMDLSEIPFPDDASG